MIIYSEITRYDALPFQDYLRLRGHSHSSLKGNVTGIKDALTITDNIRVGSIVDSILTEPAKANMNDPLYPYCKKLAAKIKILFGDVISSCEKQISYTAIMSYLNFQLPVTGRLDFLLPGYAVIDLKITASAKADQLIEYMGYPNQVWHYSKMAIVPLAYLLVYSIPLDQIFVKSIDVSSGINDFWAGKILDFGVVPDELNQSN